MTQTPVPALVLACSAILLGCCTERSEEPDAPETSATAPETAPESATAPGEGRADTTASPGAGGAGGEADDEEVVARQELEGGLIVEDLVIGEGEEVPPGATVTIHYDGRLTDGTPFDSSYDDGAPATFPLGALIEGWQKGIPGMRVGGKRRLHIPYQMAYGERGRPPRIPERSDLVFVIEMLGVE